MNDEIEHVIFPPETKIQLGAVTYIVAAHFDDKKEALTEKLRRLLSSETAHLQDSS